MIDRDRNREIFARNRLKITEDSVFMREYFGTYPIIRVNGKYRPRSDDGDLTTFEDTIRFVRTFVHRSFVEHRYLINSSALSENTRQSCSVWIDGDRYRILAKANVTDGLRFLSECLYRHYGNRPVFVIGDDYDSFVHNGISKLQNKDEALLERMLCFYSGLWSILLVDNRYVERALITGLSDVLTLYAGRYRFFDQHRFVGFYGSVASEIDLILLRRRKDLELRDRIRRLYNGYTILGKLESGIYDLASTIDFLVTGGGNNEDDKSHPRVPRFFYNNLRRIFRDRYFGGLLKTLLRGKSPIFIAFRRHRNAWDLLNVNNLWSNAHPGTGDDLFSSLVEYGLLTPAQLIRHRATNRSSPSSSKGGYETGRMALKIPNEQTRQFFREIFVTETHLSIDSGF